MDALGRRGNAFSRRGGTRDVWVTAYRAHVFWGRTQWQSMYSLRVYAYTLTHLIASLYMSMLVRLIVNHDDPKFALAYSPEL